MWLSPPHLVNLSISFIGVTATNNLGMSWWLCEVCTYSYCTSMYFHSYSNKPKNIMMQVIVYIHLLVSAYPNGAKNQSYVNGDLFAQSIWYKMLNFSIGLIYTHTTVHFTWAVVAQQNQHFIMCIHNYQNLHSILFVRTVSHHFMEGKLWQSAHRLLLVSNQHHQYVYTKL